DRLDLIAKAGADGNILPKGERGPLLLRRRVRVDRPGAQEPEVDVDDGETLGHGVARLPVSLDAGQERQQPSEIPAVAEEGAIDRPGVVVPRSAELQRDRTCHALLERGPEHGREPAVNRSRSRGNRRVVGRESLEREIEGGESPPAETGPGSP